MFWAVSLSTTNLIARSLTAAFSLTGIRSLADFGKLVGPLGHPVALPPARNTRRCTYMHFGENQLSRSLIGLSPLPTAHPPGFQPWWVRASTPSYRRFTLAMGRSPRFGSRARDYIRPIQTRFRYGYPTRVNLATHRKLAGSFFKRHAVTRYVQAHIRRSHGL